MPTLAALRALPWRLILTGLAVAGLTTALVITRGTLATRTQALAREREAHAATIVAMRQATALATQRQQAAIAAREAMDRGS